jgi:hypothetical protein
VRNYCCDDPLLDWLDLYGEAKGFTRDDHRPDYDPRTDFRAFVLDQAIEFERTVIDHLSSSYGIHRIRQSPGDAQTLAAVQATWLAMNEGSEIIAQGVLWNAQTQTYGCPELLIRSDVLLNLFPTELSHDEARQTAPDLPLKDRPLPCRRYHIPRSGGAATRHRR